ncbi:MAG: hypothetical protein AB7Q97_05145 [Gammaproteobacteria bacterium]
MNRQSRMTTFRWLYAAALLCWAGAGGAAVVWVAPSPGAWEDGANWSGGQPPGALDSVDIGAAADVSVSSAGNAAFELLTAGRLGASGGNLSVAGALTNAGTLDIQADATTTAGTLANQAAGAAKVTGANARLEIAGHIDNAGSIELADGGFMTGASLLDSGIVAIAGAANLMADQFVATATGQLRISGAGSRIDVGGALSSAGILAATQQGHVEAASLDTGLSMTLDLAATLHTLSAINAATSHWRLADDGTQANIAGSTTNAGTIDIQSGASLQSGSIDNVGTIDATDGGQAGADSAINGSAGHLDVSGTGSRLAIAGNVTNHGTIDVGPAGTFEAGGVANTASGVTDVHGDGAVADIAGTFDNAGSVRIAGAAALSAARYGQFDGVTLLDAGSLAAPTVAITGGLLAGAGTVVGQLGIGPGARIEPGLIAGDAAVLDVDGDMVLSGIALLDLGAAQFDLGAGAVGYDRIAVGGNLLLDGTLRIALAGSFTPKLGDFFDVFTAMIVALGNPAFELPALAAGLHWSGTVVDTATGEAFRLAVVPLPPAALLAAVPLPVLLRLRRTVLRDRR